MTESYKGAAEEGSVPVGEQVKGSWLSEGHRMEDIVQLRLWVCQLPQVGM